MKALAETLRADAVDRNAAGVHDGWDDPYDGDAEPAVRASEDAEAAPEVCGKRLYKVQRFGNLPGRQWVRCKQQVDVFGDCPECDR